MPINTTLGSASTSAFKTQGGGQLYLFTTATFGTGGATGRNGPNITQARTAIGNPSWASSFLNMTTNGVQLWTVPKEGSFSIQAKGARGGVGGNAAGYGSTTSANFMLTAGNVLGIVVGQMGITGGNSQNGGYGGQSGGGASFVWNYTTQTLMLIAGGGGGSANVQAGGSAGGETGTLGGGAAGTGDAGGYAGTLGEGGGTYSNGGGGGGGSWSHTGTFLGGLWGGPAGNGPGVDGGFGCGGASNSSYWYNNGPGGGGGGYRGGNGGNGGTGSGQNSFPQNIGFGGTCYNNGTNKSTTAANNYVDGSVIITLLS
jgi:hypothetical protein